MVSVLHCFSPSQLELSAAEISQQAKIPIATTYRILASLTEGGLIERDKTDNTYKMGIDMYFLGSLYRSTQNVIKNAEAVVETLNKLTNESVFLSVFDKGNEVIVFTEESGHAFRFSHKIGIILPAYITSVGKAYLSELSMAELDQLYPDENLKQLTKKTIPSKTELRAELEQIRKNGFAICREEGYEGVIGIGALIRGSNGRAVAGLSIALPISRINDDKLNRLVMMTRMGASLISYQLGYKDTVMPVRNIEDICSWWKKEQYERVLST